jgi:hypothetical protein
MDVSQGAKAQKLDDPSVCEGALGICDDAETDERHIKLKRRRVLTSILNVTIADLATSGSSFITSSLQDFG